YPAFWNCAGNIWMYRTMFGEIRLPLDWPVYVSHAEASAYASWLGRKLPTEAQYHRAAYGVPGSRRERRYPWGDEPPAERTATLISRAGIHARLGRIPQAKARLECTISPGMDGSGRGRLLLPSTDLRPCRFIPATRPISLTANTS